MALQEDADVIGVSMLSGGHHAALSRIMELLRAEKAEDIIVIAGGFLPDPEEVRAIMELGVKQVFDTDTRIEDVVKFLHANVPARA